MWETGKNKKKDTNYYQLTKLYLAHVEATDFKSKPQLVFFKLPSGERKQEVCHSFSAWEVCLQVYEHLQYHQSTRIKNQTDKCMNKREKGFMKEKKVWHVENILL